MALTRLASVSINQREIPTIGMDGRSGWIGDRGMGDRDGWAIGVDGRSVIPWRTGRMPFAPTGFFVGV